MNTMVFLEDTLNQLQSFSTDEKQWLADKLYEQIREEKKKETACCWRLTWIPWELWWQRSKTMDVCV